MPRSILSHHTQTNPTNLQKLTDCKHIRGKRVWVRANMDIPVIHGRIAADTKFRLEQNVATLRWLIRKKARVVLLGHRGRPHGRARAALSLQPLLPIIRRLLPNTPVIMHEGVWYKKGRMTSHTEIFLDSLAPGSVGVLENIRFIPEEEANDASFAQTVAQWCDVYVQDAFSVCHRVEASTVRIPRATHAVAGYGLERELRNLQKYLTCPRKPYVVVVGGVKISTKLSLLKHILTQADDVLLGGALANTMLQARGVAIGQSITEPDMARKLRARKFSGQQLHLPLDVIVAKKNSAYHRLRSCAVGNVQKDEVILDLGPETVIFYGMILAQARTIVWNGPMGFFEDKRFAKGTNAIAKKIGAAKAVTIVGGGETVAAISRRRQISKMTVVSSGGGALLAWLEGKPLPGIRVLEKRGKKYGAESKQ
ncbi:MAG: phosphoglycerate kinase [Parcubacteria group bacterium CG08_land_8_20_14_0_20_48_21]|nr:MAG: phosphoglycerate kinase [Parcubacteria group bacterium CG08_land_8_20_14_0_20_48_21]PIW79119.1 MAG: phosphoglycerate kinase [Parcubacteria group bacterium CG_4_8_14_3_um_filter_48_16]PIY78202.1 MAG: phosphoglycerate kinase [Parcubacteria group bacterium CG_4_10_14_0_8_um_filter_48_154]PIZ78048.1 MAG: phosphoglycerate kinase [bacterium CG_4_10_14_0_2_um_filter_48_144]PJC40086.1 MAG: phosphoglycerate kinase [Parcubacteria group bacterium CG_4_9_14_0_2_um_filter_48_40]PJE52655.1 MAG: phos